jgi:nucleotide-binding universal stress UspA family protein
LGGLDPEVLQDAVAVGDDGSDDSGRAVSWALDDARRRGVPLVVIRAWSITRAPRPAGAEPGYIPSEDEFAEAVQAEMAADLSAVLDTNASAESPATVVLMPAHCSPTDALVHASSVAAVTVVGARGSGLARLLGSVSTSLIRSAHGPVVVIPGRDR